MQRASGEGLRMLTGNAGPAPSQAIGDRLGVPVPRRKVVVADRIPLAPRKQRAGIRSLCVKLISGGTIVRVRGDVLAPTIADRY
jgi:hypothetical protein